MSSSAHHYYVPDSSSLPILGSISLFILALGSLNLHQEWGIGAVLVGVCGLLIMLVMWLKTVNKESSEGLYSVQMDKTFRWAMFWFLVTELFLFGVFFAIAIQLRFSITPWLAGQSGESSLLTHYLLWPDFTLHWPFITIPEKAPMMTIRPFIFRDHFFILSLFILFMSAFSTLIAHYFFQKNKRNFTSIMLLITFSLGFVFVFLQTAFLMDLIKSQVIVKAGIYGSFFVTYLIMHLIHVVIALVLWINVIYRFFLFKVHLSRRFLFDAIASWWIFLALMGFLELFFVY